MQNENQSGDTKGFLYYQFEKGSGRSFENFLAQNPELAEAIGTTELADAETFLANNPGVRAEIDAEMKYAMGREDRIAREFGFRK
jgi:hypothetical protein